MIKFIATIEHYRKALEVTQGWDIDGPHRDEVIVDYECECFLSIAARSSGLEGVRVDDDGIHVGDIFYEHSISTYDLIRAFDSHHNEVYVADDPDEMISRVCAEADNNFDFPITIKSFENSDGSRYVY